MFKRKYLLVIIFIVLVGGLVIKNLSAKGSGKIETATAQTKNLRVNVSASGKTKAKEEVNLHFQTGGRLSWVGVKEGDHVTAYRTIASLDRSDLQKNLEKALRDYSKERNDFEEDKLVTYKDKVITDTVKRILEKNQWDLEKAILDVELRDISLKWATLTTPISGIVTKITAPIAGVNIGTSDTFSIANPDSLVFNAAIDETDVGKVAETMKAQIHLDAFPNEVYQGVVSQIAYAAETSAGGATVYPVEVKISGNRNLRVGLNGDVEITLNELPQALTVPVESIKEFESGNYVIKKRGTGYEKVIVKVGVSSEADTQIIEGLKTGDEVVVKGFQFLPKSLQPT